MKSAPSPIHRLVAFSALLAGCEIPQLSLEAALQGASTGKSGRSSAASGCQIQTFRQPIRTEKLDLVFVTDTSGSLSSERDEIADGIDHFIRALPQDQDLRVAVMLGHSPLSPYAGRLWRSDGGYVRGSSEPWVLSTADSTRGYVRAKLKNKLRKQASERESDGGEMGLGSLLLGLDGKRFSESRAKGFFREDSALAVIFVSDENDICAEYPAGRSRVDDPDGIELPAKRKFCTSNAGISPENVIARLEQIQNGRPLVIGGMIYSNPDRVPRGLENEVGYGYLETIHLAGNNGLVIDLADGHLDEGLGRLGKFTSRRLELQESFPIDTKAGSHVVRVDGRQVGFRVVGNELIPSEYGTEGSVIEIVSCPDVGSNDCIRSFYDWNGKIPNRTNEVPSVPLLLSGTNFADDDATAEQLCRAATGPSGRVLSQHGTSWVSPCDNVVVRWDGRAFQRYNGASYNRWLKQLRCACVSAPVVEPTPVPSETPPVVVVEPTPVPSETPPVVVVEPTPVPSETPPVVVVEPTPVPSVTPVEVQPTPSPRGTETPWDPTGIGI
jgi:hypothetical protein